MLLLIISVVIITARIVVMTTAVIMYGMVVATAFLIMNVRVNALSVLCCFFDFCHCQRAIAAIVLLPAILASVFSMTMTANAVATSIIKVMVTRISFRGIVIVAMDGLGKPFFAWYSNPLACRYRLRGFPGCCPVDCVSHGEGQLFPASHPYFPALVSP